MRLAEGSARVSQGRKGEVLRLAGKMGRAREGGTHVLSVNDTGNLEGHLALHLGDGRLELLSLGRPRGVVELSDGRRGGRSAQLRWSPSRREREEEVRTMGSFLISGILKVARVAILGDSKKKVEGREGGGGVGGGRKGERVPNSWRSARVGRSFVLPAFDPAGV